MFTSISLEDFKERTAIYKSDFMREWASATHVVSLRDFVEIHDLRVMPMDYLKHLLSRVPLIGDPNVRPFMGCSVSTGRLDPRQVLVPQTFVERSKYQTFIEEFDHIFDGFAVTKGIAKCTALIAFGRTRDGGLGLAHYLPPIIEAHSRSVLLDGMHRNFLVMRVGTTLEAIFLEGVKSEFPCTPQAWSRVRVVNEKPPKEERFFDLKSHLFRDLKFVGIDG